MEEELSLLRDAVESLTGLPSRWSGQVVLMDNAGIVALKGRPIFARKLWACDILVNTDVVEHPVRWRTYLHEMLHSVSVGGSDEDSRRFLGWEEGVVEWWQRHLRVRVLERINVHVPEAIFELFEADWTYNHHLTLEALQQASGVQEEDFYFGLLRVPLAQRLAHVQALNSTSAYHRLFAGTIGKLR